MKQPLPEFLSDGFCKIQTSITIQKSFKLRDPRKKTGKSHVPVSKSHFATQAKEKQLKEFSKKKKTPAEAAKRKV